MFLTQEKELSRQLFNAEPLRVILAATRDRLVVIDLLPYFGKGKIQAARQKVFLTFGLYAIH
jgi:hypothetical protein